MSNFVKKIRGWAFQQAEFGTAGMLGLGWLRGRPQEALPQRQATSGDGILPVARTRVGWCRIENRTSIQTTCARVRAMGPEAGARRTGGHLASAAPASAFRSPGRGIPACPHLRHATCTAHTNGHACSCARPPDCDHPVRRQPSRARVPARTSGTNKQNRSRSQTAKRVHNFSGPSDRLRKSGAASTAEFYSVVTLLLRVSLRQ